MAVRNTIVQSKPLPDKAVEYKCGDETVKLSPSVIRNYLVSGDGNVTDQEVAMFLNLCRYQHLNPFLREAYIIKFGNQPATIVTGKEAITKRAVRNKNFAGQEAGVVVINTSGQMEYRTGALVLPNEALVGGWAKVHVQGYEVPIEAVVSYEEYVGRKKNGEVNGQWQKKPATMIRKVALVQALREAVPEDLGGMYASEEMGVDFNEAVLPTIEPAETVPTGPEPLKEVEIEVVDQVIEQKTIDDLEGIF